MKVFISSFWLPKDGNRSVEYEDAFQPKEQGEKQGQLFRFAIADGASEGMLSGKWAAILVRLFYKSNSFLVNPALFLSKAYKKWSGWKTGYLQEREKVNRPVQWYEEAGLQAGAFSTFLGLTLTGSDAKTSGAWKAAALGDSCLFLVRGENLYESYPVKHSRDFANRPLLISSNPSLNKDVLEAIRIVQGEWFTDDRFYLMTDALAYWFLKEYESGGYPWLTLSDLNTSEQQQGFGQWVDQLRKTKQIRNDDVTLLRIDMI